VREFIAALLEVVRLVLEVIGQLSGFCFRHARGVPVARPTHT
jgi:hypothetical protein